MTKKQPEANIAQHADLISYDSIHAINVDCNL